MFIISERLSIPDKEIRIEAVRAAGPGGQNVNKVSTAVHLRFDIRGSSLPEKVKEGLLAMRDHRISGEGTVVIKARRFRSLEKNREDALERLRTLIVKSGSKKKKRKPTRPSRAAKKKRMDSKTKHSRVKKLRGRVDREQ
ncbi:alternative ribosome rescue aminoacyl-tRNA hydrolase ArfB [Desulfospira joergensenii]|uniref:alternative ribosome rescue aminoacyl-tRNA hydrolase ArfB n=1 Tax=Desulfospira joergensenii TaxID=53329 RepID=UPI0004870938|nr:alternative ribosome rescue aminoacyl-tRNA hydrolase ArfB [Desulfospira joergensenii]